MPVRLLFSKLQTEATNDVSAMLGQQLPQNYIPRGCPEKVDLSKWLQQTTKNATARSLKTIESNPLILQFNLVIAQIKKIGFCHQYFLLMGYFY